ncbi:hypothetical protein [Nocardia australiensis]|uniref:hypothetical protein n=1 Tax=Nocardia australiensis TaxID=2887191 RepID=UPI001D153659|nr:hypothetical protein [Nocardia australiensis]
MRSSRPHICADARHFASNPLCVACEARAFWKAAADLVEVNAEVPDSVVNRISDNAAAALVRRRIVAARAQPYGPHAIPDEIF